jgi:hypothetical protein
MTEADNSPAEPGREVHGGQQAAKIMRVDVGKGQQQRNQRPKSEPPPSVARLLTSRYRAVCSGLIPNTRYPDASSACTHRPVSPY